MNKNEVIIGEQYWIKIHKDSVFQPALCIERKPFDNKNLYFSTLKGRMYIVDDVFEIEPLICK